LIRNFFICISTASRNNVCGAHEFPVNYLNAFREFSVKFDKFKKSAVKSCIFSREFGWSLHITHWPLPIY